MKNKLTLLLFLLSFNLVAQQLPETELIINLNFDNDKIEDLSLNNHSIINHNAILSDGISGKGLSLNGTDAFLEVSYAASLAVEKQFTISVWYKHQPQATSDFYPLVEQSADEFGGHSRYGLWVFNQKELMTCIEPDACPDGRNLCQRCMTANITLDEERWYHIASLYDGQTLKIFVDGQAAGQMEFEPFTGISVREYPLTIGTDKYAGNPAYLNGILDEIRVYKTALNEEQITFLATEFEPTSTKQINTLGFSVFPNPSPAQFSIQSNFNIDKVKIWNAQGQLIKEIIGNNIDAVHLREQIPGLYFLQCFSKDIMGTKRIMILKE